MELVAEQEADATTPDQRRSRLEGKPGQVVAVLLMLGLFILHQRLFRSSLKLPEEAYTGPSIAWGVLSNPEALAVLLGPIVALVLLPMLLRRRGAMPAWTWRFEARPLMRTWAIVMAAVLVWWTATYPYNFYLDRWHTLDRGLLVLLGVLVAWKPIFIVPLVVLAIATLNQLQHPVKWFALTHKEPIFDGLTLLVCWLYLKTLFRRQRPWLFWLMLLSLIAAHYFIPGLRKVQIGWAFDEDMQHLAMAARDNGWFGWLSETGYQTVLTWIGRLDVLFIVGTLVLELGVIVLLWKRGLAILLLPALASLHLGIFATSGIFFWEWVVLDTAVLGTLFFMTRGTRQRVFGTWPMIMTAPLIFFGDATFDATGLGWFDTPVSTTYRITVVGESGTAYEVSPAELQPFDFPWSQGRLGFTSAHPQPLSTYGSTRDRTLRDTIADAQTKVEVLAVLDAQPLRDADRPDRRARQTAAVSKLLLDYFRHANTRRDQTDPLAWVRAPLHVYTATVDDTLPDYARQETIVRIYVDRQDRWLTADPPVLLRSERVIDLPVE